MNIFAKLKDKLKKTVADEKEHQERLFNTSIVDTGEGEEQRWDQTNTFPKITKSNSTKP